MEIDWDKVKPLKPGEPVPEGAVRVHLGIPEQYLAPRGSMQKNSVSLRLYEKLMEMWETWTDPKYKDSCTTEESRQMLLEVIKKAYDTEVRVAWEEFCESLGFLPEE